jgi:hypothetical protein
MKIIKLNRRYKAFKEEGHTVGLRFDSWSAEAGPYEKYLTKMYGSQYAYNHNVWRCGFGSRSGRNNPRPYFITMRDEKVLTAMLLAVQ